MNKLESITMEKMMQMFDENPSCIRDFAFPITCCKNGAYSHMHTVTYPIEYIMTAELISAAKKEYRKRADEVIKSIDNDNLNLLQMGCEKLGDLPNYRLRMKFIDKNGVKILGDVLSHDELMWFDLSFENEKGCWGYSEANKYNKLKYTKPNLLYAVNEMSEKQYKKVVVLDNFISCDEWDENVLL